MGEPILTFFDAPLAVGTKSLYLESEIEREKKSKAKEALLKGRISIVDLLLLTSSVQLRFLVNLKLFFLQNNLS